MKLEIGGGDRNKGGEWINLDICQTADVRHDLNVIPWPIENDTAEEIYSSHCIEHVGSAIEFLRECARIGKAGARVEIRCPDATSEMAMCPGHTHVVSINVMRHIDHVFPAMYWAPGEKRLRLIQIIPHADDYWFPLARSKSIFAGWTDEDILTWVPRTRHENCFVFRVE